MKTFTHFQKLIITKGIYTGEIVTFGEVMEDGRILVRSGFNHMMVNADNLEPA